MNFDSTILAGLIGFIGAIVGAVIGAAITGYFVLAQTSKLLKEERTLSDLEQERETKSIATALLWEIDYFYKMYPRNTLRILKDVNLPTPSFHVRPLDFESFTVFESTADKVGMFEPLVVRTVVSFYGSARAYLALLNDYQQAKESWASGDRLGHARAEALLDEIKKSSEDMLPLTRDACELLAGRSKADYTFEAP